MAINSQLKKKHEKKEKHNKCISETKEESDRKLNSTFLSDSMVY